MHQRHRSTWPSAVPSTRPDSHAPAPALSHWTGPTRASDQDRAELVELLGAHAGSGRLTLPEFEDRASAAYGATTLGDLGLLLADLPAPAPATGPRARRARSGWAVAAPFAGVVLVGAICLTIWTLTSLAQGRFLYFWPIWVVGPWSVALLGRGFGWGRRRGWSGAGCSGHRPPVAR